jgi:hypothetical protein
MLLGQSKRENALLRPTTNAPTLDTPRTSARPRITALPGHGRAHLGSMVQATKWCSSARRRLPSIRSCGRAGRWTTSQAMRGYIQEGECSEAGSLSPFQPLSVARARSHRPSRSPRRAGTRLADERQVVSRALGLPRLARGGRRLVPRPRGQSADRRNHRPAHHTTVVVNSASRPLHAPFPRFAR